MPELYPLLFKPIFKEKIWGNQRLKKYLNLDLPTNQKIGESWELSDRAGNETIIINGFLSGKTLPEVMGLWRDSLMGTSFTKIPSRFPLLIKFLDIDDSLSVQVHPDDGYAKRNNLKDFGKTEFWYIWKADPGSAIKCGFTHPLSPEQVQTAIKDKTIGKLLKEYKTASDEGYLIEAGTVHAPEKGNLIIEIQENSDITFRLYDWDRPGLDGKPRPLHIKQSMEVIDWEKNCRDLRITPRLLPENGIYIKHFTTNPFFSIKEFFIDHTWEHQIDQRSYEILIVSDGKGSMVYKNGEKITLKPGRLILLPAFLGTVTVQPERKLRFLSVAAGTVQKIKIKNKK